MMIMLGDDPVIEIFDSPENPPNSIEGIDVQNGIYQFCDDQGQRYVGEVTYYTRWFTRREQIKLRPEGVPDIKNVLALNRRR